MKLKTSRKELQKRFATLIYIARAEGVQPPAALVLRGKPKCTRKGEGKDTSVKVNTRLPASTLIKGEMAKYNKSCWVYYDSKFRTSACLDGCIAGFKEMASGAGRN